VHRPLTGCSSAAGICGRDDLGSSLRGEVRARMASKALVRAAVLEWARTSAGLSIEEAAAKMRMPPERLEAWERGDDAPTVPMLRTLAGYYKRPLAVFYLPAPPRDFDAMRDYRRLPAGNPDDPDLPSNLRLTMRRVEQQRDLALDLTAGDDKFTAESFGAVPDDAEQFGERLREWLGVAYDEQRTWREPYTALNAWVARVEERGILVTQVAGHKVGEFRGFSFAHDELPAIALNSKDAVRGKVFTLLHECAHVILRASGLCDLHSGASDNRRYDALETRCNAVAAAALMPLEHFREDPLVVIAGQGSETWQKETLQAIARRFTTSEEAVLRRLLTIGKTTAKFYDAWRGQWDGEDDDKTPTADRRVRIPYERLVVRDLGREYVRRVMDARARNVLTLSEASDYLGVTLKWVDAVEREAMRSRAV
jgi:Zn-dependent peptidase ImmA (M78 family)/DNA-binding transcriptional regulator YiaG